MIGPVVRDYYSQSIVIAFQLTLLSSIFTDPQKLFIDPIKRNLPIFS